MKIKKGDTVQILKGKDKGKTGSVERVFPKKGMVVVVGINEYKRHVKARMMGQVSEIRTIIKPIPVANVALIDPVSKKITRVGYKILKDKKVRIAKKSGEEIK